MSLLIHDCETKTVSASALLGEVCFLQGRSGGMSAKVAHVHNTAVRPRPLARVKISIIYRRCGCTQGADQQGGGETRRHNHKSGGALMLSFLQEQQPQSSTASSKHQHWSSVPAALLGPLTDHHRCLQKQCADGVEAPSLTFKQCIVTFVVSLTKRLHSQPSIPSSAPNTNEELLN